jgi:multidrug efflux pump subunit AcrA (membrane-fusion protein)
MSVKTPKTTTLELTGVVERAELIERAPFRPMYYMPGPTTEMVVDVALRLDDGNAVYFKSVAGRKVIGSVPGAAVVVYSLDGEAANWMTELNRDKAVATPGTPNENKVVPTVKPGDRITVRGRLKAEKVSRAGNKYKVITHVHKLAV